MERALVARNSAPVFGVERLEDVEMEVTIPDIARALFGEVAEDALCGPVLAANWDNPVPIDRQLAVWLGAVLLEWLFWPLDAKLLFHDNTICIPSSVMDLPDLDRVGRISNVGDEIDHPQFVASTESLVCRKSSEVALLDVIRQGLEHLLESVIHPRESNVLGTIITIDVDDVDTSVQERDDSPRALFTNEFYPVGEQRDLHPWSMLSHQ